MDAAILAGGLGTRLRGVVDGKPKPMAEVQGRPFVEWLLLALYHQGIRRVVLCTGYLGQYVRDYFGDGSAWGVELVYSEELTPLGTGGAVRQCLDMIESDPFFLLNGDSYCPLNVPLMVDTRRSSRATGVMQVTHVSDCGRFGSVAIDDRGAVRRFVEKGSDSGAGWINAGVYLLDKATLLGFPKGQPLSLERDVLPGLIDQGLFAVKSEGKFIDIGTPQSYREASSFDALEALA